MDSKGSGGGWSGNVFQRKFEASTSVVSISDLPLFALTDETQKIGDLFRLNIFPGCFQHGLFQAGTALLNSSTARIANEDHDVAQNAAGPLLNERSCPRFSLNLAPGQMRVLAERQEQFDGSKQAIQSRSSILRKLEHVIPAPFDFGISFYPPNLIGDSTHHR